MTLLALFVIAGLALVAFTRLFNAVSFIQTHHMQESSIFEDIRLLLADAVDEDLAFILSNGNNAYNQTFHQNIEEIRRLFAAHARLHVTVAITPPEVEGMKRLQNAMNRLVQMHDQVEQLIVAGHVEEARQLYNRDSTAAAREALAIAGRLVELEREESNELATGAQADANRTHRLILIVVLVAAVAGGTVAVSVTRSVTVPVQRLLEVTRRVDRGNLGVRTGLAGGDEIGELAQSFDRMIARLEAVFAEQERFLADVSHELRTPITIVRGHLDVLERGARTPGQIERALTISLDELDRMARLVNDLLLLARATRVDFLAPEPIALPSFLQDLLRKGETIAPRPWRLGPVPAATLVADRDRLTQALLNLMRNAAEHTKQDQAIELSATSANGWVNIVVADQGEGIPEALLPHVFERFRRGQRAESRIGLGLSIAKAIVNAHSGDIRVQSHSGEGTTFTIRMPANPYLLQAPPTPPSITNL